MEWPAHGNVLSYELGGDDCSKIPSNLMEKLQQQRGAVPKCPMHLGLKFTLLPITSHILQIRVTLSGIPAEDCENFDILMLYT